MRSSILFVLILIMELSAAPALFAQENLDEYPTQSETGGYDETYALPPQKDSFPQEQEDIQEQNTKTNPEEEQLSTLETMYAERIDDAPLQFGYDLFLNPPDEASSMPMGAVQDDFILGIGDELQVTFSGQRNTQARYKIDSQGQLTIEDFPSLMAAGMSLQEFKNSLERTAAGLHNTQVYVTLSGVRQIGVLVVGHVNKPGRSNLTVFHTVLDALMLSGGIRKDGSLRQIKLVRGGQAHLIDLYDVFMQGGVGEDIRLRDGDRIVVPPIGPTVVVAGAVKRPGIYEIYADSFKGLIGQSKNKLTLRNMLQLGGGVLSAGQNRFMRLGVTESGYEEVGEITDAGAPVFGDGSVLVVARGQQKKTGEIQLLGQTRKPGSHDLIRHPMLSDVLNDPQVLGEDIYPLIGVIERWNSERLSNAYLDYSIRSVLKKEKDESLKDGDKIYLLSNAQIIKIFSEKKADTDNIISNKSEEKKTGESDEFLSENISLISFLKERAVMVGGAVRLPGFYPVAKDVTLEDVIATAGGMARDADESNIEITSIQGEAPASRKTIDMNSTESKTTIVQPGDAIRIMQKFRKMEEQGVYIQGEVNNPGRYDVLPDDKISDLIKRAGGLTAQAYPAGAVLSRESERSAEEARFKAAKQDMERSLAAAIQKEKNAPDATQIEMVRELAAELGAAKAVGRITAEVDPSVLALKPELDMLLEAGDRLYIPKRPLTVRVSGEILSPANLQFEKGKKPVDYIREAGGFTFHADKNRTFVLYPNGSAQPLQVSNWNHKAILIPPGSTIIVPRDPKPFDFIESARDFTQILSNLAVTAIFVDDLQD